MSFAKYILNQTKQKYGSKRKISIDKQSLSVTNGQD
jgi:hypothetical protein